MERRGEFTADTGIISEIIERNLLAPSPSQLASKLGYSGRTTINRLRAQTTGEEAIREFCQRLSNVAGISYDDLLLLGRLMQLCDDFTKQMKREFGELSDSLKFNLLIAFISDDYSIFSESYQEMELNRWILVKGYEKEMFFFMLSLFLLTDKTKSFYDKRCQTGENYKKLLTPICKQLKEMFPSNSVANSLSSGIFNTPMASLSYPCFLTAVRMGGVILKGYISGYEEAAFFKAMMKVSGLPNRTFWDEGENRNQLTFLRYVAVNKMGNGLYEYFQHNILTGRTDNPAQLYFYNEKDLGFFLKRERVLFYGNYIFDGKTLKIKLLKDREHTEEFKWQLLTSGSSERVRQLDRLFTDSYINNVKYESLGMERFCGITISEVIITKNRIILNTLEGDKFTINRDSYPYLREVTPDKLPLAYMDKEDNRIYIEWEQLGSRIALDEFSKTPK